MRMTDIWARMVTVGFGGFIGANARYLVGLWAVKKWGPDFPIGTFIINISGSFILGLFAAMALKLNWNPRLHLLIAVGFVGAYTTFSTFEVETLQLVMNGERYKAALINLLGSVIFGFAAAWLGVMAARWMTSLKVGS